MRDIELALGRAGELLDALKQEVSTFTGAQEHHPITRRGQIDSAGREIITARFSNLPPPEIGILAGDCVHRLRTALDYLIAQMSRSALGRKLDADQLQACQYPIRANRHVGNNRVDLRGFDNFMAQSGVQRNIGNIPLEAQKVVHSLQPFNYHYPNKTWLAIVSNLDNTAKHRNIPLTRVIVAGLQHPPGSESVNMRLAPIQGNHDTAVATIKWIDPVGPDANLDSYFSFDVGLLEPRRGISAIYGLELAIEYITSEVVAPLSIFI